MKSYSSQEGILRQDQYGREEEAKGNRNLLGRVDMIKTLWKYGKDIDLMLKCSQILFLASPVKNGRDTLPETLESSTVVKVKGALTRCSSNIYISPSDGIQTHAFGGRFCCDKRQARKGFGGGEKATKARV